MGKSTLMTKLTGTHSEAAAYEFTTLTAVPGITRYNGARLQVCSILLRCGDPMKPGHVLLQPWKHLPLAYNLRCLMLTRSATL